MNLLFIARGGERTGLGHFARSRRLIETARYRGHEAELFCLLDGPRSPIVEGARAIVDEAELVGALRSRHSDDVIVVDIVSVQGALARALETSPVPVVALCPVAAGAAWPSLVVLRSASEGHDERIPHLIGLEYAVLGRPVTRISESAFVKRIESPVRHILVCFGGADPDNETLATVRALISRIDARLDVLLGPAYSHDEAALQLGAESGPTIVKVHRGDGDLWEQFKQSSVLVGGGGLLAYEAAYAGLPSVHLVARGIRRQMLAPLEEAGAVVAVERDAGEPHRRLQEVLADLDCRALKQMRRAALALPLGNGHVRCIQAIEDRF